MDVETASVPTSAPLPAPETAPPPPRRARFGARTVLVPLGAMFLHVVTSLGAYFAFVLAIGVSLALDAGNSAGPDLAQAVDGILQKAWDTAGTLTTQIAFAYSLVQILLFALAFRLFRKDEPAFYPAERPRGGALLSAVGIAAGLSGFVSALFIGLEALAPHVPFVRTQLDYYTSISSAFTGDGSFAWTLLSTCLAVPIAEELIFRGIVMNEFRRVMPVGAAVVLQGVVFALFHMNTVQSLYVLVPGILLGAVYAWTGSLYASMALHVAFNVLGAAVPLAIGDNGPLGDTVFAVECVFLVVAVLACVWLATARKKAAAP